MKKIQFRAKPMLEEFEHLYDVMIDLKELMDEQGYITGNLCYRDDETPYILGDLIETTNEYTVNEFWYPVYAETIEMLYENNKESTATAEMLEILIDSIN